MVLVDNAGGLWPSINHSPWNGITLADFVMPFFLFIVGVALSLTYKVWCILTTWTVTLLRGCTLCKRNFHSKLIVGSAFTIFFFFFYCKHQIQLLGLEGASGIPCVQALIHFVFHIKWNHLKCSYLRKTVSTWKWWLLKTSSCSCAMYMTTFQNWGWWWLWVMMKVLFFIFPISFL